MFKVFNNDVSIEIKGHAVRGFSFSFFCNHTPFINFCIGIKIKNQKKTKKTKKHYTWYTVYTRGIRTCSSNHLNSPNAFPECGHCPKGGEPELLVVTPKQCQPRCGGLNGCRGSKSVVPIDMSRLVFSASDLILKLVKIRMLENVHISSLNFLHSI